MGNISDCASEILVAVGRKLRNRFKVSHAVKRGEPTAAQRYLDSLLDEAAAALGAPGAGAPGAPGVAARTAVSLGQLIYHCMRKWPHSTRLINGLTGASLTNEQMLNLAVPVARALAARGASGSVAAVVMRNHEQLAAVYYGALFAGVTLCMLEPASTESELRHFMALAQPRLVFCDADRRAAVAQAAAAAEGAGAAELVAGDELATFIEGHGQNLDDFVVAGDAPAAGAPAVLLPTSGSTGLPKAALISHEGLIAQLPSLWSRDAQFPRPTACALFLSTAQWMTHTDLMTACPVFDVASLTAARGDLHTALHMIDTYKPTFFLAGPGLAQAVVSLSAPEQLASLRTLLITGAPLALATLTACKEKLHPEARVWNGYGMTEAQGFVTLPDSDTPLASVGKVLNIFDYKFIDDEGKEVSPSEGGELILSSSCIIKAYLGEEGAAAHRASLAPGGWWRTGDVLRQDARGHLHYRDRKKFWFKHNNYQISPEEVEAAVLSVAGVAACAVSGSERGAAAAVQLQPGARVSREQIHAAVDSSLSEYKRLHGGIAFVAELPRTHSGKLHRRACAALLAELLASSQCC